MRKIYLLALIFLIPDPSLGVKLAEVCSGWELPILATAIESGKVVVVEQGGKISSCDEKTKAKTVLLDISAKVVAGGEMGLLGLAFHPKFSSNRTLYIYYSTYNPKRVNVVAKYALDKAKEEEILTVAQPYPNHDGGNLVFGEDGYLYIGKGDGGAGYDPHGNGQNKMSLLGKILRIDVDQADPVRKTAYSIPKDNPFAQGGGLAEIYAYGIRNPWRFTFDSVTKTLWLADVGQDRWEEIDIVEKGKNYGWRTREGLHCTRGDSCSKSGMEDPIHEYSHDEGVSITGGYVYRGRRVPALVGAYVYGDYGSGKIWALHWDPKTKRSTKNELLLKSDLRISSFGEDRDKEILVVSHKTGVIFRMIRD